MIYDVSLRIRCTYTPPAAGGRHLLRLLPASLPGAQRIHAARLDVLPAPAERRAIVDFFGNPATHVVIRETHETIELACSARVERIADAPSFDISPGLRRLGEEIALYRGLEPEAPHHFLGASPRIRLTPDFADYARAAAAGAATAFEAARDLCHALHRDLAYDAEATLVDTAPETAFAGRHGVCQDFAQIMIACLRSLGIPAAYVSGFLRTVPPPGRPRLEGADAMHAWVRAWCGVEAGWIEFDPTNAAVVGADHIVIARGRDYGDVAPIAGVLRTAGGQESEQAVDVIAVGG